jgi:3-dehydroquinate dehydratase II
VKFLILQGPNLNLLGTREPDVYGSRTLAQIHQELQEWAAPRGLQLEFVQSNIEGDLINAIQAATGSFDGIVFNPAGYSHSSVALRDCIAAVSIPVVEVHLSNIHAREEFRHNSLTGAVARGVIGGFGEAGYKMAIEYLADNG